MQANILLISFYRIARGEKIYQFSLCDTIKCTNHKLPNSYSKPEQTPGNAVKSAKFIHCVLLPPFQCFFSFWRQVPSCSVQVLDKTQSTILRKKNLALPKGIPKATSMHKWHGAPYGHKHKQSA